MATVEEIRGIHYEALPNGDWVSSYQDDRIVLKAMRDGDHKDIISYLATVNGDGIGVGDLKDTKVHVSLHLQRKHVQQPDCPKLYDWMKTGHRIYAIVNPSNYVVNEADLIEDAEKLAQETANQHRESMMVFARYRTGIVIVKPE